MRLIRARPFLVDGVLAVGLGVLAQVMVWSGRVAGPRVAVAALFLLVGFPLIVRRRLPLIVAAASKYAPTCPSRNRYDHRRARR